MEGLLESPGKKAFLCLYEPCVHPFFRTDIVTTISDERLKQLWENWQGIFTSNYWLYSGGQRSRSQQAIQMAKASTLMLGRQSPIFYFRVCWQIRKDWSWCMIFPGCLSGFELTSLLSSCWFGNRKGI